MGLSKQWPGFQTQLMLLVVVLLSPSHTFFTPHQVPFAASDQTSASGHRSQSILVSAAAAGSDLLPQHLQPTCSRIDLKTWDHTIGWGQPAFALVLHHARAIVQPWGLDFSISAPCSAAIQPPLETPGKIGLVMASYNLSTHADGGADPVCLKMKGVWLLLSDRDHGQDNVYEEGTTSWYPSYLVTHYALKGIDLSTISITHVGGNKKGFLAFQDVYQMYGRYVPWQMVLGGEGSKPTCVEFETAVTIKTYWSWLSVPVMAGHNPGLTSFASSLARHFARDSDHPGTCKRKLVFAARARMYRCIVNKEEVMAAIALTLPGYEIEVADMAVLPLSKQIQLVRTADIYMFEHGGAGPLVMMQSPGTVSLEVFPWGFADPMYRNMAIMTGKVYLSWQNPDKSKAVGNTEDRNTNSIVDVPALMAVITSAKHIVNNNVANKFVRGSGELYDRHLCAWCEETQKMYACNAGDM